MVPCRPTLLYKRDYVENSTAIISLIHYKDKDKFPFYPNNSLKSLSKATKIPSMWYWLTTIIYATFLSLHMQKPKNHLH